MLERSQTFASYSVNDLQVARAFYAGTLGLEVREEPEGLAVTLMGGARLFLYPKPNHTPATYTVLNFEVQRIAEVVDALTAKGVPFEHYTDPLFKSDAKGIVRGDRGPAAIAWFKDPAGNILSLVEPRTR